MAATETVEADTPSVPLAPVITTPILDKDALWPDAPCIDTQWAQMLRAESADIAEQVDSSVGARRKIERALGQS